MCRSIVDETVLVKIQYRTIRTSLSIYVHVVCTCTHFPYICMKLLLHAEFVPFVHFPVPEVVVAVCPAAHLFEKHRTSHDLGLAGSRPSSRNSCHGEPQSVSCSIFGNPGSTWERYE